MSIASEITKLNNQRVALANNLTTKGVTASTSETLTQLVPKVLDIPTGGGGGSNAILHRGHSVDVETASGTSVSVTVPGFVDVGDLLVMVGFTRSALTVPSGWTQIVNFYFTSGTSNQYNFILFKIAGIDDPLKSYNVVQASAGRMAAKVLVAKTSRGIAVRDTQSAYSSAAASCPSITAVNGDFVVYMGSSIAMPTLGRDSLMIDDLLISDTSSLLTTIPRLASGVCHFSGQIPSGPIKNLTGTNMSQTGISVAVFKSV